MLNLFGKFATTNPKLVLTLTLIIVVIGGLLGSQTPSVLKTGGFNDPKAQSTIAQNLINNNFNNQENLIVLINTKKGNVLDSQASQFASNVVYKLKSSKKVDNIVSFWQAKQPGLSSIDNKYGLIMAHVIGNSSDTTKVAGNLTNQLSIDNSSYKVQVGGFAEVDNQINSEVNKSLAKAESLAVPLTLIFLMLAFGTITAALLPLIIAGVTVVLTFAELYILGHNTEVSIYAINLTTALGLGLAVDYSLFIVSRYREEINNKLSVDEAIIKTLHTAGKTVIFSAIAVSAALATMAIFPLYFLQSFAYTGVGVVIFAAITATLVLPSVLKLLGPKLEFGKLPWHKFVYQIEAPLWRNIASFVTKHPIITSLPAIAFLIILALPVKNISFSTPDDRVLPKNSSSQQVGDITRTKFPANPDNQLFVVVMSNNLTVVKHAAIAISNYSDVTSVSNGQAIFKQGHNLINSPYTNSNGRYSLLTISTSDDYQSKGMYTLVQKIRNTILLNGSKLYIGGRGAELIDTKKAISNHLVLGICIITITTFIVLFLFSGSIIQPIRALITNSLTLGAAFGVIVWIFQYGHLRNFLNFIPTNINISMPILLFAIAFGLSMDYEVFLMSRIKEQHDSGVKTDEAVSHGLARAGRIVSTAASILAISFFAFGVARISFLQLFGIGTGLAILFDATLIRGVLVPAFMHALQENSWYAPKLLKDLHSKINLSD